MNKKIKIRHFKMEVRNMKFSIKKEILLENLNKVSHAVSTKNVIPVLAGIKFDLTKKGLTLLASDNDIDIKVFIDKKYIDNIEEEGSIVIQGKFLLDIIRKIQDGIINIEVIDGLKLMLYNDNSKFNLNGIDSDEFPNINIEKSSNPITLDKKIIKTMVNQTIYATSNQESRPILTGINFKIEKDILECIATDSYRLAKKRIKLDNPVDNPINIVIPGRNIGELVKIIDDEEENINIHIFTNKILFEFDNILYQSRLLNDVFPNISRLIPSEFKLIIDANLNDLFNVVDRASLLTSEKEKNVIKFETEGNTLIVTSNTPEIGRVEEKLAIKKNNDEEIKIAFSAKHMMDALRTIDSKNVRILLNSEISPIILNTEDNDDLLQLLMPIKTY
jgi:DNA polymerase-3 subunit beta